MGLDPEYHDGQTPLDEDEKEGLLIATIATRGELYEFEQQNIEKAIQWVLARSFKADKVFTETFIHNGPGTTPSSYHQSFTSPVLPVLIPTVI